MTPELRLILNPRVSVFRHNGGIYLFDPATRTYASMNEAMLAFVTKPDDVQPVLLQDLTPRSSLRSS
jgi:hypothetical protein